MSRQYVKLMVINLTKDKLMYYLPSGIVPDSAVIRSIKTRKVGKTVGNKTIESGASFNGLVLGLKTNGTDVQYEIPLANIEARSTNGDCMGYVFPMPIKCMFGETGSELRSYDPAATTTGNAVELEISYEV